MDDGADRGGTAERGQIGPAFGKGRRGFGRRRLNAEPLDRGIHFVEQSVELARLRRGRRQRRGGLSEDRRNTKDAEKHGEHETTAQTHHPRTAFRETRAESSSTVRKPAASRSRPPSRP